MENPTLVVRWHEADRTFDMPSPLREALEPRPTTTELPAITLKGLTLALENPPDVVKQRQNFMFDDLSITLAPEGSTSWLYRVEVDANHPILGTMRGFGRMVRLEHSGGRATTYGHLNEIAASVQPGTQVERGQVIGYVGSTGLASGPHLHYEVEEGGVHLDPLQYNSELEVSVDPPARRAFEKVRTVVTSQLARLPMSDRPSAISMSAASFKSE